ncbi:heme o synthase [Flavobacterium sp.]|mgnify:FL=1|uniref:heme o synthase n=1 Tax=Flavobacterium sp. TaxID=239 RepID=UPI0008D3B0D1|nr:heme o synthase [Flavobacterium sp.]OGS63195.1 MAG: protoheme IX farnesyltransferase [Flavobacteria bacterium GWF1_32_7]HBD26737.1 protoheme IX farnesyltransferase [Flavobacterium sp.]
MDTNTQPQIKKSLYKDFVEITKARLSISVVVSTIAGYLLGFNEEQPFQWLVLVLLIVGGYCMVGASNVFNQIIEIELDAKMDRTKNRPLPSGRITKQNAFILGCVLTILGLAILYNVNPKTAMFGAISIFMYVSLYTPLKTLTPLSVFVGAFPGAIPFMLGWVAATGHFGIEAGTLFIIQFFWQFPHFWAIGWFLYDDYKKAGFFMLPTGKKDKKTALQTILYTIWMILASIIPAFGFTGNLILSKTAAVIVFLLGLWMLFYAVQLHKQMDSKAARKLMIVSVSYISLLQIIYVIDKFLR